jgi:hypothetical protein
VAVLKFGTVDLDERSGTTKQNLGRGLDDSGFTGTRRAQEKQVTDWTTWHVHARQVYLVHVHDALDGTLLSDDLAQEPAFEIEYFGTSHFRIKEYFF